MRHQHVPIPLAMKPMTGLSRFLFRIGKGEWMYKLLGFAFEHGSANPFKDYTPTKNDIIIACHARSGTNWMMQITLQIAHLGKAHYDYIYDVVAWPDFLPGAAIPLAQSPPPSPTGLRVIKSHGLADHVPINDAATYITVIRDPKEVMVSLYHFAPQAFAYMGWQTGEPDYFVEKFLMNQVPGVWWARHTAGWWALRHKPNIHIVTFKDLKINPAVEIDRISDLLDVQLTPEQRNQVLEKSSFGYMKAINHKFSPIIGDTKMIDIVRKGKTGTDDVLFTDEQFNRVDAICKEQLKQYGSDLPYDELFG